MTLYGPDGNKKIFEVTDASNIIPGGGITVGNQEAKEKLRERIGFWEDLIYKVNTQMAYNGFTQEQVDSSIEKCYEMLDWYQDLLEVFE